MFLQEKAKLKLNLDNFCNWGSYLTVTYVPMYLYNKSRNSMRANAPKK